MQQSQEEDTALVARLQQGLIRSLRSAGITQTSVLSAFCRVPRHAFIKEWYERGPSPSKKQRGVWRRHRVDEMGQDRFLTCLYQNQPLVTRIDAHDAPCSSSSQPSIMAEMLEILNLQPGNRVLEIGTGTGYQAALLAELVGAPWFVTTIDIDQDLVERAKDAIRETAGSGMTVIAGNGLQGYAPNAPYHRIIATGSYPLVPSAWIEQLAPGGSLIMNLQRPLLNVILLIKKEGDTISGEVTHCNGMFMKLHNGEQVEPSKRPEGMINPVIEKLTSGSFHPTNLFNKDFAFFLQCHLLSAMVYRMTKGQEQFTYLYDPQTQRVIRFDTDAVRGSADLWRELCSIALTFQRLGQPSRNEYIFAMKEDGQQVFQLGEHSWRIV